MNPVFSNFLLGMASLDVAMVGCLSPAQVASRQQVRLSMLLNFLAQGSTLYARHLCNQPGSSLQLHKLPVFNKVELMERFDEWVVDPQITLSGLQDFVADPDRIAQPYLGKYVVWESSGSSGQPAIFVQDAYAMAIYDALESLRHIPRAPALFAADMPDSYQRVAFVGVTGGHFASIVQMRRMQTLYPWATQASCNISVLQPMASLVRELNAFQPTIVATYPSVAIALADQQERASLHIAPCAFWTGGETLSAAARARVTEVMHCAVRDHYGASEFLSIASECSHGHLHANTDWIILEPVDENFHPVPPGQASATTLLTHLGNRIQPLVRYDMGDQITVLAGRCACGSALPVIQVSGRSDAPLTLCGCNGEPVVLLPLALTTVLEEQAGIYEFQLHQIDHHTLNLQIPQTGGHADIALQRGCRVLKDFVALQGAGSVHITSQTGVPMQRGKSGKTQRVMAA